MRPALPAAVLAVMLVFSSCGDDSTATEHPDGHESSAEATPTETPTETSSAEPSQTASAEPSPTEDEGQIIEITFKGDTVSPNGERVEVKAQEPIILRISADAPGELHIHSSPEQEMAYKAGKSELSVTIERPGIVEVESHDLGLVIVQLEVTP